LAYYDFNVRVFKISSHGFLYVIMFSDASNGEFETKSLQYRPIDGLYSKAATFKRTFPEITCPICKIVFW